VRQQRQCALAVVVAVLAGCQQAVGLHYVCKKDCELLTLYTVGFTVLHGLYIVLSLMYLIVLVTDV